MKPASLAEARAAKERLVPDLEGDDALRGVGVAPRDGGFVVLVHVVPGSTIDVPDQVEGVPVVVEPLGDVRSLDDS